MSTLITVGICVRNGESMLPSAVESILSQDYPKEKTQVIFVDDGSRDKTPQIISHYTTLLNNRVKSFRTQGQGLGHARNIVVDSADGEFILFVDADEILTPSYVKTQVQTLCENPKVGVTAGVFKTVPNNFILNLEVAPHIVNQKNYGKPKNFVWKTEKLIGTGGSTFRSEAIRQVKGFDEGISGAGEDMDLVLRIKRAGWLIQPNAGELYELHGGLSSPEGLWRKYFWYGYGCQKCFQKTLGAYSFLRMSPLAGLITGVLYSFPAYRVLRQKQLFLLPLHYGFKHAAWTAGFMKGQLKA